jgi:hypothetical protein
MDLGTVFYLNDAVQQFARTYLVKRGWFASLDGVPRDNEGEVPWYTYPALIQLKRIVRPNFKVFEYGCGASSLWWARNVAEVFSVEHDANWAARICANKPANVTITVRQMDAATEVADNTLVEPFFKAGPELPVGKIREHDISNGLFCPQFIAYATELTKHPAGTFDIIVVDGMARVLTAWLAAKYLKDGGFIIFDNSDRWQYNAAYKILTEAGFYRLDYYGPGPVNRYEWCTSIFTKTLAPFAFSVDSPKGVTDMGW